MMKGAGLRDFRIRFAKLVVLLDILILLIAGLPIAFFFLKGDIRLWIMVAFAAAALPLSLYFMKKYRATKDFLKEH